MQKRSLAFLDITISRGVRNVQCIITRTLTSVNTIAPARIVNLSDPIPIIKLLLDNRVRLAKW